LILLRQRDATGLITFDEAVREVVPPRVRAGQWARLVRGLERTPDGGGTAAETALGQITSLLVRRGLVVLVSDLLFDRELALTALRYLRHRGHHVIVLHLMDPAEAELSGAPGIPALLHLLERRIPPEAEFPPLRYLSEAERQSARRLRLRHVLLLLLRTALIALIVLAAARPLVPAPAPATLRRAALHQRT